ncbi:MAG: glycine betaine/proline transport system substrate-binding protein [Gaiellales bacterium]|jgi:glycine betaine/proline transport system substrate-binding protein|nr:glycine betaine/proline transport system substrate-binding protein [Gaiellales bacterium]
MASRFKSRPRSWAALGALSIAAAATALVGASTSAASNKASCGTVTLNENSWVGSTANVYVVKNVLEQKYKCNVQIKQIAEIPVYQALASGQVDAVLEDWQHVDQYKQYEQKLKVAQDAGSNGVTGHIGWYVPSYVVQQHPEMKTWKGLLKDWALFKTAESGGKGELLDGDPSYVTADEPLISNLKLNLKVVYAGGEASQITSVKQAYAQKKPILFYWYTPQWLNAELKLTEVMLPPRTPGCDAPVKATKCAYPSYDLRKVISTKFAKSGSPAVNVIKKFSWTAQDQNNVAVMIAGKKMKPDDAAKKWIAANPTKVKAWES